jgi:ribosomal RNA methyltransferase Nop2
MSSAEASDSYPGDDLQSIDELLSDAEESGLLSGRLAELAAEQDAERAQEELDEVEAAEDFKEAADSSALLDKYVLTEDVATDLPSVQLRVHNIVRVLGDFKRRREPGVARSTYVTRLVNDLSLYYGYLPFLIEKFLEMFSPLECLEFLEASEKPRPLTIRVNTIKTKRRRLAEALINRGVNLDPLGPWSRVGLQIYDSQVPLGATPEYLLGHYMLQSAASFLPVLALDPKPEEKVLDMCGAPGGKTTYIAQMMGNTGTLFANDFSKDRLTALVANVHRLGVTNTIVTNYDGRRLPEVARNFDRVLCDAPCTGLGVVSRDASIKISKSQADITSCAYTQKQLAVSALRCLRVGGVLVYSTCSVTVEENEAVVDYLVSKLGPSVVRIVPIPEASRDIGRPGFTSFRGRKFHPALAESRRVYPHVHNMDGFFVCRLEKVGEVPAEIDAGTGVAKFAAPSTVEESTADEDTAAPVGAFVRAPLQPAEGENGARPVPIDRVAGKKRSRSKASTAKASKKPSKRSN